MQMIDARRIVLAATVVAGAGLTVGPAPAAAQTAGEILETALERYETRMEGIEDYTVVQSTGGSSTTLYYERVESEDGRPRFRSATPMQLAAEVGEGPMGELMEGGGGEVAGGIADPYAMFDELASRAELRGTGTVEGRDAYVISVEDLSGVDFGAATAAAGAGEARRGSFEPQTMKLWLDTERYVTLRTVVTGTLEMQGEASEVTMDARMSDYREVDGMLHPFRTEVDMEGMMDAMPAGERAELEKAREQLEKQLEGMSEEQRAMMERMMEKRMPGMEEAMKGAGPMTMALEVEELRVNEGPPESETAELMRQQREAAEREAAEEERAEREARREAERRDREAADRRARRMGEPRDDLERFEGRYQYPDRPNRVYSIVETCAGSGYLELAAEWGDVAPPALRSESDTRFVEAFPGPREPIVIEFEVAADGKATGVVLDDPYNEPVLLERIGPLAEGWEASECGEGSPRR